ncbi:amidohydrolase family protein [Leucobacter ruminantium]
MPVVRGIRALDERGDFGAPVDVSWASGRFRIGASAEPAPGSGIAHGSDEIDGTGLWMIPGLVDAHAHLAWHAFDAADRALLSESETAAATDAALARLLAAGFTSVRDAGGLAPSHRPGNPSDDPLSIPRLQHSVTMIDRSAADAAGGIGPAVEAALAAGANWVKLVATASVASPPGSGLDPVFTPGEVRDAVRLAEQAGAGVMVHAWGGAAIDAAIEAGALSIEHGIFLTDEQACRAAERGMTLVPTLRIYRLVQRMIGEGSLPAAFRARVDEAVSAHPAAVLRARDAGLALAVGTDSGTPEQHGTGGREVDALVAAGLAPEEALLAATRGGAELLARVAHADDAPSGVIADGAIADAVILRRDPRDPGALGDPDAVVAVILGGRVLDPAVLRPAGSLAEGEGSPSRIAAAPHAALDHPAPGGAQRPATTRTRKEPQ